MWIRHNYNLINLSQVKVVSVGRNSDSFLQVYLDDFAIQFTNWNEVIYFVDGLEKLLKFSCRMDGVYYTQEVINFGRSAEVQEDVH
jgi:hypothetical protein